MKMDKVFVVNQGLVILIIGILITINPLTTFAKERQDQTEVPSIKMLEFLADFETDDGRWLDPSELEGMIATGWSGKKAALEAEADE